MNEINYRYNSSNQEKIKAICEFILDKSYGDTISKEKVADLVHMNIENEAEKKRFDSIMSRAKNILIDYGYILKSVSGVGYYILKPKHISSYCYRTYVDRTKVLLEKSERILNHVDKSELNEIREKEHNEMKVLNRELYGEIGLVVENSDYGQNRAYYNSLED